MKVLVLGPLTSHGSLPSWLMVAVSCHVMYVGQERVARLQQDCAMLLRERDEEKAEAANLRRKLRCSSEGSRFNKSFSPTAIGCHIVVKVLKS